MAFAHCDNLREVRIPKSVETIAPDAFKACESLSEESLAKIKEKIPVAKAKIF